MDGAPSLCHEDIAAHIDALHEQVADWVDESRWQPHRWTPAHGEFDFWNASAQDQNDALAAYHGEPESHELRRHALQEAARHGARWHAQPLPSSRRTPQRGTTRAHRASTSRRSRASARGPDDDSGEPGEHPSALLTARAA